MIDEVQASPTPVILFIDKAHTLIGAGGQAGTGDTANLLNRRFQPVHIDEPDLVRCGA